MENRSTEKESDAQHVAEKNCQSECIIPDNARKFDGKQTKGSYVYFLMRGEMCVYVGQTKNLASRICGHGNKSYDNVLYLHVADDVRIRMEMEFIKRIKPEYNKSHNEDFDETRGRKPLPDELRRTEQLRIWLTPAEKSAIEAAACDSTLAEWARKVLLRKIANRNA